MSVCRTLAVVHGKSELIFCRGIAKDLRINVEYDSNNGGENCIQISHLGERFCSGHFKSENTLHKKYDKLEYYGGKANKMPYLKIFPIMDTDDSPRDERSYRTNNMFRSSVFGDRIIPIFNAPNLDGVLTQCGFEIDSNNKVRSYEKMFDEFELSDLADRLKDNKNTNLWVFLDHCISIAPSYQNAR